MSALVLDRADELRLWDDDARRALVEQPEREAASAPAPPPSGTSAQPPAPGEATLEDLVVRSWKGLTTGAAAPCPSCGTPLRARWSAGAGIVGGHCDGCGADLR